MKRVIAAALAAMLLLCGCGQGTETEEKETAVSSQSSVESSDTSSEIEEQSSQVSEKESSVVQSSVVSSSAESKTESKEESSKTSKASSEVSKKTDKTQKTSSAVSQTSQAPQQVQYYTYTYDVGNENDPIRQVEPDKVQQYIVEESTIVTEPEPEKPVFENKYESIPEEVKVNDSWFDDCVFLGDSLTVGLSMYNDRYNAFGDADFVCAGSLSYWNSQWDLYRAGNVHPIYKGRKILLEDAVKLTGAKKAIITLGMNDIGIWGPAGVITHARSLLNKIKAKSPDVKIYLQTVSPIIYGRERPHLSNSLIRQYNENLKQFAAQEGYGFLDSYNALANNYGYLPNEFCSDPGGLGLHLTFKGCAVWADFLKSSVATAYPGDEIVSEPESSEESPVEQESEEVSETVSETTSEQVS